MEVTDDNCYVCFDLKADVLRHLEEAKALAFTIHDNRCDIVWELLAQDIANVQAKIASLPPHTR